MQELIFVGGIYMNKSKLIIGIIAVFGLLQLGLVYGSSPFCLVEADSTLEHRYGRFPYDRSAYAAMIDALSKYQPRAIVVKFFFDLPRSSQGDKALAKAMLNRKVILQASLDNREKDSSDLDPRFSVALHPDSGHKLAGTEGWIPLPLLQKNAWAVGFPMIPDTARDNSIPLFVQYRGKDYKSLWLLALELGYPELRLIEGKSLSGSGWAVSLNEDNEMRVDYSGPHGFPSLSMEQILQGKVRADQIKDKVIILYYDKSPLLDTKYGRISAHDVFNRVLWKIIHSE